MEKKINKLEHSHVEVIVTVDKETWQKAQQKAFEKAASNIEVKGFRKGKAPLAMVKDRVDQGKVMNDAINELLPVIYRSIIEEDHIEPYARPNVDVTKLSEEELEVKFLIVTAPEVELGQYKGYKLGKPAGEVSDADLEKEVNSLLDKNASLVLKEGEAASGDTVILDFEGSIDGVPFEGGADKNYELVLGSGSFIPGFEDQLIGHKAGEHVDVNVTFPENYYEKLANKAAVFACDIHEVKEKKLPELTDEFAKEQNIQGVEDVASLKNHLKEKLQKEADNKARSEYMKKLLAEITKNSKFDIPEEVLDNQAQSRREDFEKQMKQSNLTLEQYLQIVGQTEEQYMAQLKERAKEELTNYLILDNVAKKEGLSEVTPEELEFEYAKLAEQYSRTVEEIKNIIEPQLNSFKNDLVMNRADKFLYENND